MISRETIDPLNLILELSNVSPDVRRQIYMHISDRNLGLLNQVDTRFRLFGNDIIMWKQRLRHLLPKVAIPELKTGNEYVHFYRFMCGVIELRAFSMELLINSFFIENNDQQADAIEQIYQKLMDGNWRPLNDDQLHQLATDLKADAATYDLLLNLTKIYLQQDNVFVISLNNDEHHEISNLDGDGETEEHFQLAARLISGGYMRVSYLRSKLNPEIMADPVMNAGIHRLIALGIVLHQGIAFLLARNHSTVLLSLLKQFYRMYPNLLNLEIQMDSKVKLGEQLFLMSLGAKNLSCARQMIWLPGPVASELILWMISINAECIHASRRDLLHEVEREDDEKRLYYNPLYLTIESIIDISNRELELDTAKRYIKKLQSIAIELINNGEDPNEVAKIKRTIIETPASLTQNKLSQMTSGSLSEIDTSIRDALLTLVDIMQLKANMDNDVRKLNC